MDNTIYFCSLPFLDSSYQNVIDFSSLSSQYQYFSSQVKKQLKANVVSDSERTNITINAELSSISKYDYLFLIDSTNKRFFYFINNKIYKSSTSCILEVELDVYSTYLFDHSLLDSVVERTHVNRWEGSIPTREIVDEGFPIYDYQIIEATKVADLSKNYIISASAPLGKVSSVGNSGGNNGTIGGGGNLEDFPESRKITNSAGEWLIPTIGTITATFPAYPNGSKHTGIDIAHKKGTNIYSARAGEIVEINLIDPGKDSPNYGKFVKIDHGDGLLTIYGHCDSILCDVGQVVNAGELIATQGNTGYVISSQTGPDAGTHLHWEIRLNGVAINPDCSEVNSERKLPVGSYVVVD